MTKTKNDYDRTTLRGTRPTRTDRIRRASRKWDLDRAQYTEAPAGLTGHPGTQTDSAMAEWWNWHLGCVGMGHRDDDIALFVSGVDVAVSLGDLFQRIASINDRVDLPRLNQLFEEF